MEKQRSQWSGSLVFYLAAIGSAIGLGNLWGFPYKMGANGGLYFLLIYLLLGVFCGSVVMCVEMVLGRFTGRSPIAAFAQLSKKWKFVGAFGTFSATLIMGFYSVLLGYSLRYFVGFAAQIFGFTGFGGLDGSGFFNAYTGEVGSVVLFTVLGFILTAVFVTKGTKGIERFNKIGIPALFLILIAIIIYNFTLPGSEQGYVFMFTTQGLEIAGQEFDFFQAVRTAGGQMLFSLSLGMGIMITYGSYMPANENISKSAWLLPLFDTVAALCAGMAIFPAVFAMGEAVNSGPGLLFITMHNVFSTMGYVGNIVGGLFYLLVVFAGLSSTISLMEVTTSSIMDAREISGKPANRTKITFFVALLALMLSIPVSFDMMGGSVITQGSFIHIFGSLLDFYDFITEGIMMPAASVLMCVFVGWKLGIPWLEKEMEKEGQKWHSKKFFIICVKYITPILMTFVLISLSLSFLGI